MKDSFCVKVAPVTMLIPPARLVELLEFNEKLWTDGTQGMMVGHPSRYTDLKYRANIAVEIGVQTIEVTDTSTQIDLAYLARRKAKS